MPESGTIPRIRLFYSLLLAVSATALCCQLYFLPVVRAHACKVVSHSGIYFNSDSPDPGLSALKEFREKEKIRPQKTVISFRMKPSGLYYGNIFQTASNGRGIRAELYAPPGSDKAAFDVFAGRLPGRIEERRYTVLTDIRVNETYRVNISVENNEIEVIVNGKRVLRDIDKNIRYRVTDIAVGTGYNKERRYKGEISDFSIEYTILRANAGFMAAGYLFLFLLLFSLFKLIFKDIPGLLKGLKRLKAFIYFHRVRILGLLAAAAVVGCYNLIIFNRYFPLSEGWFSVYAEYILRGAMPYRDFHFMLPPLYPLQMAAFMQLFGQGFLALRVAGLITALFITGVLYLLYLRLLPVFAAVLATAVSVIFQQSGTAFINYDLLHFFTLYALAALYFMLCHFDACNSSRAGEGNVKIPLCAFFSGFFACLALLIKHSNGLMVVVFLSFAFMALTAGNNNSKRFRNFCVYLCGILVPLIVLVIWLFFNSALQPFILQVLLDSIAAKGCWAAILSAWFPRLMTPHNIIALYICAGLSLLAAVSLIITPKIAAKNPPLTALNDENHIMLLYFISAAAVLCVIYPYFEILFAGDILSSVVFIELYYSLIMLVTVVSAGTAVVYLAARVFRRHTGDHSGFLIAALSLGLLYGTGTSGGFATAGAFLGLGLVFSYLFYFPRPFNFLSKAVFFFSCFGLLLFMTAQKYNGPYKWWGLSVPDIRQSISPVKIRLLNGFYLPEDDIRLITETVDIVKESTVGDERIFTFPNIPVFYLLTGRLPPTFGLVHWFDFTSDKVAIDDALLLEANPPKVIITLDLPEYVWLDHEKLFRKGKPLKQRLIRDALKRMTSDNGKYLMRAEHNVPDGCVLRVWVRQGKGLQFSNADKE
ncbi:MAG: glycosyltransferase family 39 protein [Candidatus Gastranaerophilales bacterium]|nr:glycosyltransferase family 39 protein [Candidatus Gastranaerophilales bacterium]